LAGSVVSFPFNDGEALDRMVTSHGATLAAFVVEPARYSLASRPYLERLRRAADSVGAAVVYDEVTSGFRMTGGGAHLLIGVPPDVAVFAKGMSNGYPMGAVVGRRSIMESAQRTFISSTSWTERIGPTAALATIRKLAQHDVPAHLTAMGNRMRRGWEASAARHDLRIVVRGIPQLPSFAFDYGDESVAIRTLYTQCMLDAGFLASGAFYPSYAHEPRHVDDALAATDRAFAVLRSAIEDGTVRARLRTPVAHVGLRGPNV
jgi:glutamate-1-semialdehyde aminotransferase